MSLCLMQKNHKLLWNIYNTRREEKKNQPFSQLTKTLSYIKLKKKKLKEKFHTRKMPFKNFFFFKKQMYGQMSLKTLQISFYFKYIWTFSRFNLH